MGILKSTNQHKKYWKERQIDWYQSYLAGIDPATNKPMWDHPHREIFIWILKSIPWVSLWEVGCGAGANLVKITKEFQGKQLGGSDINKDAIEVAKKIFVGGRFHVESAEDMLLSDNAVDVMLSDAALIYVGPEKIDQALHEITRIARNQIILCEFHGKNWLSRLLFKLKTGYNAYNYQDLLEKHGCYDINIVKIPEAAWPGFPWNKWGYIISAKVTKKI